jgi:hypothetical protein
MFLSSVRSATKPFSRRFSSRSWRSSRSSGTPNPPYTFFQRKNVALLTPSFRQISSTVVPASACRRAIAICSSVNRLFLICPSSRLLLEPSERAETTSIPRDSPDQLSGRTARALRHRGPALRQAAVQTSRILGIACLARRYSRFLTDPEISRAAHGGGGVRDA